MNQQAIALLKAVKDNGHLHQNLRWAFATSRLPSAVEWEIIEYMGCDARTVTRELSSIINAFDYLLELDVSELQAKGYIVDYPKALEIATSPAVTRWTEPY